MAGNIGLRYAWVPGSKFRSLAASGLQIMWPDLWKSEDQKIEDRLESDTEIDILQKLKSSVLRHRSVSHNSIVGLHQISLVGNPASDVAIIR